MTFESSEVDSALRSQAVSLCATSIEALNTRLDRDERDRWTAWLSEGRRLAGQIRRLELVGKRNIFHSADEPFDGAA